MTILGALAGPAACTPTLVGSTTSKCYPRTPSGHEGIVNGPKFASTLPLRLTFPDGFCGGDSNLRAPQRIWGLVMKEICMMRRWHDAKTILGDLLFYTPYYHVFSSPVSTPNLILILCTTELKLYLCNVLKSLLQLWWFKPACETCECHLG